MLRDHLTVLECRMNGMEFGAELAVRSRQDFEIALVVQLTVLGERLTITEPDAEDAIAAFDQAAWEAWEAVRR